MHFPLDVVIITLSSLMCPEWQSDKTLIKADDSRPVKRNRAFILNRVPDINKH